MSISMPKLLRPHEKIKGEQGSMSDQGKTKKSVSIRLNQEWCKGCYICLEICPKKVFEKSFEVSDKGFNPVIVAHPEECSRCLQCEMMCPDLAIDVNVEVEEKEREK
jgi:2-oxoglutarate ferredoxin oxidoreductase subunit delta